MTTQFLLVRHGVCERMDSLLFGRTVDAPLSAHGRVQAEQLAANLSQRRPVLVEASPRRRTQQTAQAIVGRTHCPLRLGTELDEVDFGRWAGASFSSLELDPDWRRWNERRGVACTPAGETMAAVQQRVLRRMRELHAAQPAGPVALVTHAEVIRAALLHCLGEPLDRYASLRIDPASISTVHLHADGARVVALNESAHEREAHA